MKILSLVLISSFFFGYAHSEEKGYEECFLEEAEQKRCEVKIVAGKKEGKETCRALDNSKVILREAQFSNGNLNGPLICRDFMNQIYMQATYANGKLTGERRDYSKSRSWKNIKEAWMVKYFENGKQIGVELFADKSGNVLEILPNCWENGETGSNFGYCLGLNYGDYDSAVRKHLQTEISKRFKEMNREVETKYSNGKIKFKARLVNGSYDGEAIWNYESGKIKTKLVYAKGVPLKSEDFFESGKPESVKLYKDGKLEKKESYYENGKLSEILKVSYDKHIRKERIERFDDKGFRQSEYGYLYEYNDYWGQMDGPYRSYDSKGVLDYDATFKKGELDGKVTINSIDRREDEVWANGKRKEKVIYDTKTGKPVEKVEYMNDGSEKNRTKLNAPKA